MKRASRALPTIGQGCCRAEDARPVEPATAPGPAEGARLFRALGDETRLAILRQLRAQGEVCACEFTACCSLAQPTVSHHLRVLREAGLITADKRGLWVYYQLNSAALEAVRGLLP